LRPTQSGHDRKGGAALSATETMRPIAFSADSGLIRQGGGSVRERERGGDGCSVVIAADRF
jgi:hypothetical protein